MHSGERVALPPAQAARLRVGHAEALVIHTEWHPYRNPDFARMKAAMSVPLIFDGRNLYDPADVAKHGFEYHSIGRPTAHPSPSTASATNIVTATAR